MERWEISGLPGTISFTPELWEEMFKRVPSKSFGFNFDPSHLYFQLIDYIALVPKFIDRIFHVHAKDSEIFEDKLKYYGIFNKQLDSQESSGFWRYRMPGLGKIDWEKFIKVLTENGYTGVLSIEHEDPLYEGTKEKVKEGLVLGIKHLSKFI